VYALTASESALDFIGSSIIAFPSYSYNTYKNVFPLIDVVGNHPVRSIYTCPSSSVIMEYTLFDYRGKMSVGAESSVMAASISLSGICFGFVDLLFHRVCAIYPFVVVIVRL
jgi:hypothetical protein